jgi:hypothetical protein
MTGHGPQARGGHGQGGKLLRLGERRVGLLGRTAVANGHVHHDRGVMTLFHVGLARVLARLGHDVAGPGAVAAGGVEHGGVALGVGDHLLLLAVGQEHDHLRLGHRLAPREQLKPHGAGMAGRHDLRRRLGADPAGRAEGIAEAGLRVVDDEEWLGAVLHDPVRERAVDRAPRLLGEFHEPGLAVAGERQGSFGAGAVAGHELHAIDDRRIDVLVELERLAEDDVGLGALLVGQDKHEVGPCDAAEHQGDEGGWKDRASDDANDVTTEGHGSVHEEILA